MEKIIITKVDNGALVKRTGVEDENFERVYEFEDEIKGLLELHYALDDILHLTGKHDQYRIQHKIVHGGKYECKERNCPICLEKEK